MIKLINKILKLFGFRIVKEDVKLSFVEETLRMIDSLPPDHPIFQKEENPFYIGELSTNKEDMENIEVKNMNMMKISLNRIKDIEKYYKEHQKRYEKLN